MSLRPPFGTLCSSSVPPWRFAFDSTWLIRRGWVLPLLRPAACGPTWARHDEASGPSCSGSDSSPRMVSRAMAQVMWAKYTAQSHKLRIRVQYTKTGRRSIACVEYCQWPWGPPSWGPLRPLSLALLQTHQLLRIEMGAAHQPGVLAETYLIRVSSHVNCRSIWGPMGSTHQNPTPRQETKVGRSAWCCGDLAVRRAPDFPLGNALSRE